jgi:hypothetical protein
MTGFDGHNNKLTTMKAIFLPLLFSLTIQLLQAQGLFSGGFRAGLTFSRIQGPAETDDNGEALENFGLSSGFHVGASFNYKLTDVFGLRAELMYAQKGVDYTYDGQSFWIFEPLNSAPILSRGFRQMRINVSNSYIETPIMAFGRLGALELSAGINPSILVSSRGFGELTYTGRTTLGTNVAPFTVNLEHNYLNDTYRQAKGTEREQRIIDGRALEIPLRTGAYEEGFQNGYKTYRFFDLGLIAGLSVYINQSLYLGGRIHYGLSDVTHNQQEISRRNLDNNGGYVLREEKDRNMALYLSLGFSL